MSQSDLSPFISIIFRISNFSVCPQLPEQVISGQTEVWARLKIKKLVLAQTKLNCGFWHSGQKIGRGKIRNVLESKTYDAPVAQLDRASAFEFFSHEES